MAYTFTETDRGEVQKLLDQLGAAAEALAGRVHELGLVAKAEDAHPLNTVAYVVSRLLVVQGRIDHCRDRLAALLDRVNEALAERSDRPSNEIPR